MRRTCVLPVRVNLPRWIVLPDECSDTTNPTNAMNCRAVANRRRSPISAAITTALSVLIPRNDLSACTSGANAVRSTNRSWTLKHTAWLKQQKFDDPCKQCVMDDYVKAVEDGTERVKRLSKEIEHFVERTALAPLVQALKSFRGISTLSAVVIAAEIGDLRRFATARQFMAFVGPVNDFVSAAVGPAFA